MYVSLHGLSSVAAVNTITQKISELKAAANLELSQVFAKLLFVANVLV